MDIEQIKRDGELAALQRQIENIQHFLSHSAWDSTISQGRYSGLGKAITEAETALQNMRLLLNEIKKLDPKVT